MCKQQLSNMELLKIQFLVGNSLRNLVLTLRKEHFLPEVQRRSNISCNRPSTPLQLCVYFLQTRCPIHREMCRDAAYEKHGPPWSREWSPIGLRIAKREMRSLWKEEKRQMNDEEKHLADIALGIIKEAWEIAWGDELCVALETFISRLFSRGSFKVMSLEVENFLLPKVYR